MHNVMYNNVSIFNTSNKISHNFLGVHHYIIDIQDVYVCSVILYRYHLRLVAT